VVPLGLGLDALAEHVRDLAQHDRDTAAAHLWWILALGGPLVILPIAALAFSIFQDATRAHRAGRFPAPGAQTIVAVRVIEGGAARALARVHQALALGLVACAAALAWLLWLALTCLDRTSIVV
jgi:hypothetical protein